MSEPREGAVMFPHMVPKRPVSSFSDRRLRDAIDAALANVEPGHQKAVLDIDNKVSPKTAGEDVVKKLESLKVRKVK